MKILEKNPVKIADCNEKLAKEGDIEQKICMAYAYLSIKNCKAADKWAKEVYDIDQWNKQNEPALDLLGILNVEGLCINNIDDL